MKIQITNNQLQQVIKETIENEESKSMAVFLPDITPFKFSSWENQGLKAYMLDKSSVELKPIEKFQNLPKFNPDKKSWSSNHLLLLTDKDFEVFNKLITNVKELIRLEEQKISLFKDQVQALIYEKLKK